MRTIEKLRVRPTELLSCLVAAALVFGAATWGATLVLQSETYRKSRLISMIVSQEQVGIVDIAGNKRNVDMMLRFVGALTSAYINFELIPVNEVGTFAAVFQSVPGEVTIDKFEYHRKNLTIEGTAATLEEYELFLEELQETEYFENVDGHHYVATDDTVRFTLECASQATGAYLDFG